MATTRTLLAWITGLGLLWAAPAPFAQLRIGEVEPVLVLEQTDVGPLLLPADIVIDPLGRTWVVDSGRHRVVAFSPQGAFVEAAGSRGDGPGQLKDPLGIGIDRDGKLYVADAGNQRIQVYSPEGVPEGVLQMKDDSGPFRPVDVAVSDRSGHLFVTSGDRHRVMKFDRTGRLLASWGGEGVAKGEFRYPATLVVADGLVYVVDALNTRIQVFDEEGRFVHQIGEWGVRPGQLFRPKGIALDSRGWIYVSDSYMDVVQVFDNGFKFVHVLGQNRLPIRLTAPTGLAVDDMERVYVCEMLGNRVTVLQLR